MSSLVLHYEQMYGSAVASADSGSCQVVHPHKSHVRSTVPLGRRPFMPSLQIPPERVRARRVGTA